MRQNLRRVTQVLTFTAVVAVIGIAFQNCGTYEPVSNPLYGTTVASSCLGASCTADKSLLEIAIGNGSVIGVQKPAGATPTVCDGNNNHCFDVGGYCESGGYDKTEIFIQLDGPTPFAERSTKMTCDAVGRFHVLVELPMNYDYTQSYQLRVTLRGVESDGSYSDNPRGINSQVVTLVPVN